MNSILIAFCSLNCQKCEVYKVTTDNEDYLREKVAKRWLELNNVGIKKEMINCE